MNSVCTHKPDDRGSLCIKEFLTGYLGTHLVAYIKPNMISVDPLHMGLGFAGCSCLSSVINKVIHACAPNFFVFSHEDQKFPVTIFSNPRRQKVAYQESGKVINKSSAPYALFSHQPLPAALEKAIKEKIGARGDVAIFSLPKDSSSRTVQLSGVSCV